MTPTARTLKQLRDEGYRAQVVERWQARGAPKPGQAPGVRIDLFGCIDVVAISLGGTSGILGVQATSRTNLSARVAKATSETETDAKGREVEGCGPKLRDWLRAGGRLQVWGWSHTGPRKPWTVVRREVVLRGDGSFAVHEVPGLDAPDSVKAAA